MKRKILSLVSAVALLLSLFPLNAFATEPPAYTDVSGHWAETAIESWSARGIIQGADGSFRPDAPITRGELAVIVDRIMKYQATAQNTFSDLGQAFYTEAMLKANHAGIIKGDGQTMRPMANITREEAVTVLGRALGLTESITGASFDDGTAISAWAAGYVNTAVAKGIIQGHENKFGPKDSITRAQVVTILNNAISAIYSTPGTYTDSATGTVIINTPDVTLKGATIGGDLIIAEGVGKGDVHLDSVKVEGKTIVRGGGENSIRILGNSQIGVVVIDRQDGKVRVSVEGGADVQIMIVDDGSDDVKIEGTIGTLNIEGSGTAVEVTGKVSEINVAQDATSAALKVAQGATVGAINMAAPNASLSVAGTVTTVTTEATATGAKVATTSTAQITTVQAGAAGTQVTGDGKVTAVKATANNVAVNTPNTKVDAAQGTTGVTAGDKPVAGGSSSTTSPASGGGGGGGGGSSTPAMAVSVTKLATAPDDDNKNASQANQNAVTVTKTGNTVTISGLLAQLKSFASTNVEQGTAMWIGLVVDTGESSILGVSYNGTALTQADVDEAASVSVGAGKFVLWVKANELVANDKTFELSKAGKRSVTTTIRFQDVSATGAIAAPLHDNADEILDENMPKVTVVPTVDSDTIVFALSASDAIPVHQNAGGTMGAWVGVAIPAPEDVTNFSYFFGTSPSDTVNANNETADELNGKHYAIFYVNLSTDAPKKHITVDWDGADTVYAPQKYLLNTDALEVAAVIISASDIEGTITSPTAEYLATYLNALFTFRGEGTIEWDADNSTLIVTGYMVAHDKDSEDDTTSSKWTIWTGRIMDDYSLDLSGVTSFSLAPDSWLHIQSAATLMLPINDKLTLNNGIITKDGTNSDTHWGYKQNGTPKYFDVLEGTLPEYWYQENVTGYPDSINILASDIEGATTSPTAEYLATYLNALFTFRGEGTIEWDADNSTLIVTGYVVAHDEDSETNEASSAWTIWTGRIMDGYSLNLSGVTAFILAPDSWLHIQSAATLTLPDAAKLTLNNGIITKDGTDSDTHWGYKQNGDLKYFDELEGTLPAYWYQENVTGYLPPSVIISASDIEGTITSPTAQDLATYLNALFTFRGTGTIEWDADNSTLIVTGYVVAHDKDSEDDTTSSKWTIWTGRIMDGYNLDLSNVWAFSVKSGSWLHIQSAANLELPDDENKLDIPADAIITRDGTDSDTHWGYKQNGDPKYFDVLEGTLPVYEYVAGVTGYPVPDPQP